jgi:hypothetical protein
VLGWADFVRRDGGGRLLVDSRTRENVGQSEIHIISVELKEEAA